MNFGERMKRIRKEKGLSQLAVAEKMGVKQQTIAQYERAANVPKYETVEKLATALGITSAELTGTGATYSDLMAKLRIDPGPLGTILLEKDGDLSDFEKDLLSSVVLEALSMNNFTPDDLHMLYNYNLLNEDGQIKARERVQELTEISRYLRKEETE